MRIINSPNFGCCYSSTHSSRAHYSLHSSPLLLPKSLALLRFGPDAIGARERSGYSVVGHFLAQTPNAHAHLEARQGPPAGRCLAVHRDADHTSTADAIAAAAAATSGCNITAKGHGRPIGRVTHLPSKDSNTDWVVAIELLYDSCDTAAGALDNRLPQPVIPLYTRTYIIYGSIYQYCCDCCSHY